LCAVVAVLVVGVSAEASAKFMTESLTFAGPDVGETRIVHPQRFIDGMVSATVFRGRLGRSARPSSTGPSYALEYAFAVGDENGQHVDTIHQRLYPWASPHPVVFTPRRQKIAMSYGGVRVPGGWFTVSRETLRRLQAKGLPEQPPQAAARVGEHARTRSAAAMPIGAAALVAVALGSLVLLWSARVAHRGRLRSR
jgi:hypothetical protein